MPGIDSAGRAEGGGVQFLRGSSLSYINKCVYIRVYIICKLSC